MNKIIVEVQQKEVDERLSEKNVVLLFDKCILNNADFDSEGLTCNFAIGEGVTSKCAFSLERLNANREVIGTYIDQLCDIEQAPSFMKLYCDSEGNEWTDEHMVVDMLVQMGTASGMLSFLYPPEIWKMLPGGVPFVSKNVYAINRKCNGLAAKEYVKVFGTDK